MIRPIVIALVVAACPLVPAQGTKEGDAEVEFRVTRFDPGDQPSPTFRVGTADSPIDVEVPLTYIGGPHKAPLRDGGILDFWRGDAERPEISLPIAAAERKDLLLFFIPDKQSFSVMKVRTPLTSIRGGDRYIVNATGTQLAIKLGEGKPLVIAAGSAGLLRGPGGGDALSLPVLISLKEGAEWKLASTENWPYDPRFRRFLFAYLSPRTSHLAFHGVSERL